jgi:Leucine-rich repeat (LRR) protein/Neuraminidase (sialidase)
MKLQYRIVIPASGASRLLCALLFATTLMTLHAGVAHAQIAWSAREPLNDYFLSDSGKDNTTKVATDGAGNWVIVWTSDADLAGSGTDEDLFVAYSHDDGVTWIGPNLLNGNATIDSRDDLDPSILTDRNGHWVVVWYSREPRGGSMLDYDIFIARSSDNGETWTVPDLLNTTATTDSRGDEEPRIATDGAGTWVTVWISEEDLNGAERDPDIFSARSTDNGVTWSEPELVNDFGVGDDPLDTVQDDIHARIVSVGSDHWIAVWASWVDVLGSGEDGDILYAHSTDDGLTWSAPGLLNSTGTTDLKNDSRVQVATDGAGNLVAAWLSLDDYLGSGDDGDIFVSYSNDGGYNWSTPAFLNTDATTDTVTETLLQVVTDGNGIWAGIWSRYGAFSGDADNRDLFATYSTDNGVTWTDPAIIPFTPADDFDDAGAHIAIAGPGDWLMVYAIYGDVAETGSDADIFLSRGMPGGFCTGSPPDTVPPIARCHDITLSLDTAGTATITPAVIDDASFDDCAIATMSLSQDTFDCDDIGDNTVTLTVEDTSGNTATCDATVTVEDPLNACGESVLVWSRPLPLNTDANIDGGEDVVPSVTTDGLGTWVAAWWSTNDGAGGVAADSHLYTARSTDNGATWSDPLQIDTVAEVLFAEDWNPQVVTDGLGTWILVWNSDDPRHGNTFDFEIAYARSTDGGQSWSSPAILNTDYMSEGRVDWRPQLATDGAGKWVAVWDNGPAVNSDIWVAQSTDAGATWSAPEILHDYPNFDSESDEIPRIATDGIGNWVVTWSSRVSLFLAGADLDIFSARSTDNGNTWQYPKLVNDSGRNDTDIDHWSRVSTDRAGNWIVTWDSHEDFMGAGTDWDNLQARSVDSGLNWMPTETLNSNAFSDAGNDWNPMIEADDAGNWVSIWTSAENIAGAGTDEDILFALSRNAGATWPVPRPLHADLTLDAGNDRNVILTTDRQGHWLAVWQSDTDLAGAGTDTDIFYSRASFVPAGICGVSDVMPPVASCRNITVQLDATGTATITPADIDNGSNDECGIANLSVSPDTFTCADLGPNAVALRVTDTNGNVATCTAVVEVEDPANTCGLKRLVWSEPRLLDLEGLVDIDPDSLPRIETDGAGNWVAAWWSFASGWRLNAAHSTDNGITWTAPVVIGDSENIEGFLTAYQEWGFDLETDGNGNWMLVWPTEAGDFDIAMAQSTDNGATWSTPVRINAGAIGDSTDERRPSIASDGAGTWIATWDTSEVQSGWEPESNIIVSRSTDNGATWSPGVAVSPIADETWTRGAYPRIETDGAGIWVTVWFAYEGTNTAGSDLDILYVRSTDDGLTWSQPAILNLSGFGDTKVDHIPDLATDGAGNWVVAWDRHPNLRDVVPGDWEIGVARSADNALTWELDDILNVDPGSDCRQDWTPAVAVDSSGTWVTAWTSTLDYDTTIQHDDVFMSTSIDGGATWDRQRLLNSSPASQAGNNSWPDVTTDDRGNWVAVWRSDANVDSAGTDYDILVATASYVGLPTALCRDITIPLTGSGFATITPADIDAGSFDDKGIVSMTLSINTFTCANRGENPVTLTVTDADGNTDACTAIVTVEDSGAVCPQEFLNWSDTRLLNTNGTADAEADSRPHVMTDNAGTWIALWVSSAPVDGSGTDPDIVYARSTNSGVNWTAPALLNASGVGDIAEENRPQLATDGLGNWIAVWDSDTDPASRVDDGDIFAARSTDGGLNWSAPILLSTDPDSPLGWNYAPAITVDTAGNWVVFWHAEENPVNGNGAGDIRYVRSTDAGQNWSAPVALGISNKTILGRNTNLQLQADGPDAWIALWHDNYRGCAAGPDTDILMIRSTDGGETWSRRSPIGATIEQNTGPDLIPSIATDRAGHWVTVWHGERPEGGSDYDILSTRSRDAGTNWSPYTLVSGDASTDTTGDFFARLATDRAGHWVTVWQGYAAGPDADIASAYSVDNGLTWSGPLPVNDAPADDIGEDTRPHLIGDTNGNWVAVWQSDEDLAGAGTDTDIFYSRASFVPAGVCGVSDVMPPVASCRNITVQLDENSVATITPADIDNGSNDECGIAAMSVSPDTFTCADLGPNAVALRVTDTNGNVATCTAVVTVQDNTPPVMICRNATVQLDANGFRQIVPQYVDGGSYDDCGIASRTVTPDTFTCAELGMNPVTLTVTDTNGNVNTCQTMVNVQDSVPPVTRCKDITVQLDGTGTATITPADIDDGTTDNCGITDYTVIPDTFDSTDVGENSVLLAVTDTSGNIATCVATVTVTSTSPCEDITEVNFPDRNLELAVRIATGIIFRPIQVRDLACGDFTTLEAADKGITDLTGLEHCRELETIDLRNNAISDLSPIAGLTALRTLNLANNNVQDLAPITGLTSLEVFRAKNNNIAALPEMSALTQLRELSLGANAIADLSPIAALPALVELGLVENAFGNAIDPIANLVTLEVLWLDENPVADLAILAGLNRLRELHVKNCALIDFSGLESLPDLEKVFAQENQISEIPHLVTSVINSGLEAGGIVYLNDNPLIARACAEQIPRLEDAGVIVLYDLPCLERTVAIIGPKFPIAGSTVTLTAQVNGFEPETFDWTYNNNGIPGAQGSELTFDPVTLDDTGTYHVYVSDGAKAIVASEPYEMTVVTGVPASGIAMLAALVLMLALVGAGRERTARER